MLNFIRKYPVRSGIALGVAGAAGVGWAGTWFNHKFVAEPARKIWQVKTLADAKKNRAEVPQIFIENVKVEIRLEGSTELNTSRFAKLLEDHIAQGKLFHHNFIL
jgi:hypothetical protein